MQRLPWCSCFTASYVNDRSVDNFVGAYSNWFSIYNAYHEPLTTDGEHHTFKIMFNDAKVDDFSDDFLATLAAHEWGHVWGLKDVSYSHVLMYSRIGDGGGTADGPTQADLNGLMAIY